MTNIVEKVGKSYKYAYRGLKNFYNDRKISKELARLSKEEYEDSKLLRDVLDDTFNNEISSDEKSWIDRIESLREELSVSSQEVIKIDYGAGSPELDLTDEEMYQGVPVALTIGQACQASKGYRWALLLFKLVRKFKPSTCIELGTCLGISTAYQAAALELNGHNGRIMTLEGAEALAAIARENLRRLRLERATVVIGRFQDTLEGVLREQEHIDFAFIDGHHDEHATLAYFEQLFPFLSERAVLVFDDISWSTGMKRAWSTIVADERIKVYADLVSVGVCIINSPLQK